VQSILESAALQAQELKTNGSPSLPLLLVAVNHHLR
jgi:hypothetical protein